MIVAVSAVSEQGEGKPCIIFGNVEQEGVE